MLLGILQPSLQKKKNMGVLLHLPLVVFHGIVMSCMLKEMPQLLKNRIDKWRTSGIILTRDIKTLFKAFETDSTHSNAFPD